jgi:hypothetical protein
LSGIIIIPAPTPKIRMTAVTKIKAVESGIKLRLEITGIRIEQTVIVIEPV